MSHEKQLIKNQDILKVLHNPSHINLLLYLQLPLVYQPESSFLVHMLM